MVGYPLLLDMRPWDLPPLLTSGGHHWRHGTYTLTTDIWWSSLKTCSNLFAWTPAPNQYRHLVVATTAHTVGKWLVHILLEMECCLVQVIYYPRQWSCGKVMFSVVCLFAGGGGVTMWPLPMMHLTSPYRDRLNVFKLVQLGPHYIPTPPTPRHERRLVGRRAVGVLLKCFLVQCSVH